MVLPRHPGLIATTAKPLAVLAGILAAAAFAEPAGAAEPAACLSQNPADWPAPSRPYFMLAIDTSGSMAEPVASANSCGYAPNDRNASSRHAMRRSSISADCSPRTRDATQASWCIAVHPRP